MGAVLSAGAEEDLSNTITVDRIIVPEERAATRLTMTPALLPANIGDIRLDFAEYGAHSRLTRGIMHNDPLGWGDSLERDPYRGKVWAGYLPSYNLKAGVSWRAIDNESTLLGLCAAFDGRRSGWKEGDLENYVRHNRVKAGAELLHMIGEDAFVSAYAGYTYFDGSFNAHRPERNEVSANIFNLGAEYNGKWRESKISAGIRAGIFAYGDGGTEYADWLPDAAREMHYGLSAAFSLPVDERNSVEAGVDADFYNYNHDETVGTGGGFTRMLTTLRPAWVYRNGALTAELGARVDFNTHARNTIRVSPDVKVSYVPTAFFAVFARAEGGEHVNTLGSLAKVSSFSSPCYIYGNSVIPVDVTAGITVGAYKGFSAELTAEYARADDWLMPLVYAGQNTFTADDVKAWVAGAELAYDYRGVIKVSAGYRAVVSGKNQIHYSWRDRSRSVADLNLSVRPLEALEVNAGLEYRSGRKMPYVNAMDEAVMANLRDAVNLHADVSYSFNPRLTVFGEVENILGRKYYDIFLIGAPRLAGHIGVAYKF